MNFIIRNHVLFREVPGHPHGIAFGNIKFHLPIDLPLGKAVQVILQNLAINWGFNIPIAHGSFRPWVVSPWVVSPWVVSHVSCFAPT